MWLTKDPGAVADHAVKLMLINTIHGSNAVQKPSSPRRVTHVIIDPQLILQRDLDIGFLQTNGT
jgi:hypothetical protein